MFSRVLIALALVAVSAQALQWVDLFTPPYQGGLPTFCMAISCAAKDDCYVAGGSNGVGFGMYRFNGQMEGYMSMLNMPAPALMIMAIGMGGSKAAPHGAVGGVGILSGVQYFKNMTTFEPSTVVGQLLVAVQDMRADRTGTKVLLADQVDNAAGYSSDEGKTFTMFPIPTGLFPSKNYSGVMYVSMVDSQTWFITLGSFPQEDKHHHHGSPNAKKTKTIHRNQRVSYEISEDKKIKRVDKALLKRSQAQGSGSSSSFGFSSSSGSSGSGSGYTGIYSAGIVKTTDGGSTWQSVFSDLSNFYMGDIDCLNATYCMAVSEGAGPSQVWLTTDGMTFNPIFTLAANATHLYSLNCVRFASPTQVWIAGSLIADQNAAGIFYYSLDAGATWHMHGLLPWIVEVMDMDILPDGSGFATAVTMFQDSTILRLYQGPVPPMPTPPPSQASTGTITQIQCPKANCTGECNEGQFGTGMCVQLNGGGSIIMTCNYNPSSISQQIFNESETCSGPSFMAPLPTNTCEYSPNGPTWFESMCTPPGSNSAIAVDKSKKKSRKFLARQ